METIKERVAYLRGLSEGLKIDDSTKEGKMLLAIVEVLDDMAIEMEGIVEETETLADHLDEIDEDLGELESDYYDVKECHSFNTDVECPNCNKVVAITDTDLRDGGASFECPNCNETIEIEWECDCGCDSDCDCECDDEDCDDEKCHDGCCK